MTDYDSLPQRSPKPFYPFLGFTCVHHVVRGNILLDDQKWQEIVEIFDERLHVGAPVITFNVGDAFLHMRPSTRVLVAAQQAPRPCSRHDTPKPIDVQQTTVIVAAPEQGDER